MAMNPKIKAKWLEALRSDEYLQIQGTLKGNVGPGLKNEGYCCLGVLCHVIKDEFPDMIKETNTHIDIHAQGIPGIGQSTETVAKVVINGGLSNELMDTLGMSRFVHDHGVHMNDQHGANFRDIADWMEKNA